MKRMPSPSSGLQKRPRPVKSCLRCHRKKLKCDREQPCSTCRLHGSVECSYDERGGALASPLLRRDASHGDRPALVSTTSQSEGISESIILEELRELRSRVEALENSTKPINGHTTATYTDRSVTPNRQPPGHSSAPVRLRGLHNTRSLFGLFPDAVDFANRSVRDPIVQPEFENLCRMFPKVKLEDDGLEPATLESIIGSLPPREVCDHYVCLYALNFEGVFRILHMPVFWSQCRYFWESKPSEDNQPFRADFVPQLALITAIGYLLDSDQPRLVEARKMLTMVHRAIPRAGSKRRARFAMLQAYCLLIIAKRTYCTAPLDLWRDTGDLARLALMNGFHKDPEESTPDLPTFDIEMRRRLWYTIMELELQSAILCSMPSLVSSISYSCKLPVRSDSELLALDGEGASGFEGRSVRDVKLQCLLQQSLPLRLRALSMLATPDHSNHLDLRAIIGDMNYCLQTLQSSEALTQGMNPAPLHIHMLRMAIQGPLFSLLTLSLQCPDCLKTLYSHDKLAYVMSCLDVMLLSEQLSFDPSIGSSENTHWKVFSTFQTDNILRAGYCACLCLQATTVDSGRGHEFHPAIGPSVRRAIDDLLIAFVASHINLRVILKQLLGLAFVQQLKYDTLDASDRTERMQVALQRFLQLCRERYSTNGFNVSSKQGDLGQPMSTSAPESFDLVIRDDFSIDSTLFDWSSDPLIYRTIQATQIFPP